jgi:hypothetical protein
VITGYNTDVEHNGVIYHVQTEDKGLQSPVILSLVYTGGAILASKRSPYDDLIANGFDQDILVERLQRQHKLICAAINAGRIEDLKRMGEKAAPKDSTNEDAPASQAAERFPVTEETDEPLALTILDEKQLRAGESVTLRIQVTQRTDNGREPAAKANITLKILGSTFQPMSTYSTSDSNGRSAISVTLPTFKTGRAAILIRAEAGADVAELRRIIQPA